MNNCPTFSANELSAMLLVAVLLGIIIGLILSLKTKEKMIKP